MSSSPNKFSWADAWLLLSVILASRDKNGAALWNVIAYGDTVNKAVFAYGELDQGLAKLIEAGHIVYNGSEFRPSDAVLSAYRKIVKRERFVGEERKLLERFLDAEPFGEGYQSALNSPALVISRDDFDRAVQAYQEWFDSRHRDEG